MNPAGIVLAIAGAWVVSQVFAGNLLQRLNIIKPAPTGTDNGGGSLLPDLGKLNPGLDYSKLLPGSGLNGL